MTLCSLWRLIHTTWQLRRHDSLTKPRDQGTFESILSLLVLHFVHTYSLTISFINCRMLFYFLFFFLNCLFEQPIYLSNRWAGWLCPFLLDTSSCNIQIQYNTLIILERGGALFDSYHTHKSYRCSSKLEREVTRLSSCMYVCMYIHICMGLLGLNFN